MCGRYSLHTPINTFVDELDLDISEWPAIPPRFNIAPTQLVPVIASDSPHEVQLFRWGLIPFWAKDIRIGNKMINARAESLAEKPAFRNALKKKRCLVLADGFYEWKQEGDEKIPHVIEMLDKGPITFAGLWDSWKDGEGKEIHSFTIITTEPNETMAKIHNRMPVILSGESREQWLRQDLDLDSALALLKPCPSHWLKTTTVSRKVNNPRNDSADILEPENQNSPE